MTSEERLPSMKHPTGTIRVLITVLVLVLTGAMATPPAPGAAERRRAQGAGTTTAAEQKAAGRTAPKAFEACCAAAPMDAIEQADPLNGAVSMEAVATTCFGREPTIPDGSDEIVGTPSNDVIIGDTGPNAIGCLGGDDIICGLGGNDSIETPSPLQGGRLWADGGAGDADVAHYGDRGRPAIVYGGPGHDLLMILRADLSFVRGDAGNDTIFTGTHADGKNRLFGGDGDDRIDGGDGPDEISGGGDELRGEQGFDALDGGGGNDLCAIGPDGGTRERCERTR
jgi:Ca2+-binding RTX toxin-like protein